LPYANESSPDSIVETVKSQKQIWDNMYAAKIITGGDVEVVVPRYNWDTNKRYRQYDDTIEFSQLFESNTSINLRPMYVVTSEKNVYKCLSNNASALSTVEPTGVYTTSNGNIATADGYIWKYMYTIKPSNKFVTDSWVPVPNSASLLDYGMSTMGIVDGELTSIIVTSEGTNYRNHSNIKVNGFTSGQTTLKLSNTSQVLLIYNINSLANLANMSVTGAGIISGTYVSSVSNTTGTITISSPTIGTGGNTSNIAISTRIFIDGDGTGTIANAVLDTTNTKITKITVNTIGADYSKANCFIYGSGSGANARVILPPKFGHAFNPARELYANNVMISLRVGQIDSTENGVISDSTTFRQIGLLKNPHKYGSNVSVSGSNVKPVISQTTNLDLVSGTDFSVDEYVYQGTLENPTAYGFINAQTVSRVRLTRVSGIFRVGVSLNGQTSGVSRTVIAVENPEFQPYSGDILYVDNIEKTERSDGQAEDIKLIINF
jgi:hypothetical protein